MPLGISALSSHILFSQFRGPFVLNMADEGAGGGDADGDKGEADKGEGDKGDKDKVEKPEDEIKKRISDLDMKNKELKTKVKEYEDAERKRQEEDAKAKGEHEKLMNQYATERDTERTSHESTKEELKFYEEMAQKEVDEAIKGITDKDKKKIAEEMLDGLSLKEQRKRLPAILKLIGSNAGSFGGPTPNGDPPGPTDTATKQKRLEELTKKQVEKGLSPREQNEKNVLMTELSRDWKPQT